MKKKKKRENNSKPMRRIEEAIKYAFYTPRPLKWRQRGFREEYCRAHTYGRGKAYDGRRYSIRRLKPSDQCERFLVKDKKTDKKYVVEYEKYTNHTAIKEAKA